MSSRVRTTWVTGWLPLVVILTGPAGTWVALPNGWETPWKLAAVGLAATLSIAAANLLERELDRRRERAERTPVPARLSPTQLEPWRTALRSAVAQLRLDADQQLDKMVRQGDPVDLRARVDAYRPPVRIGGQLVAWSELTRHWDAAPRRLVVLGDPGYGKTVAALTLVKHINAHAATPGAPVAELFGLAEWQRWRAEHPDAPLAAWLAEQLTLTHPRLGMPIEIAHQLVDDELVLPILDGLDEIADLDSRRGCAKAIDAYAGRGAPHRPFVLTCRTTDYHELAPDLVRDDQRVELVGMQPDQIRARLDEQTADFPIWEQLRLRHPQAASAHAINELFESPLRLAIALQVYRDDDPSELLTMNFAQAQERLWDLLLSTHATSYRDATASQVRAWLAWLAAGMRRTHRQRFMLHELYQLDPHHTGTLRHYQNLLGRFVGLVVGLVMGLVMGLVVGLVDGPGAGLPFGLFVGLFGWLFGVSIGMSASPTARIRRQLSWRDRLRLAQPSAMLGGRRFGLFFGLFVGLPVGLFGGLDVGLAVGLFFGLFGGLFAGLADGLEALLEPESITSAPPRWFASARPDSVLNATRTNGLLVGLVYTPFSGLLFGLIGGALGGLVGGLVVGLVGGLVGGLVVGLQNGLGAWCYYHWLRRRLARRGALPVRLPEFLAWCAQDQRGWIRISDMYAFRHRELLEHLAPPTQPDN